MALTSDNIPCEKSLKSALRSDQIPSDRTTKIGTLHSVSDLNSVQTSTATGWIGVPQAHVKSLPLVTLSFDVFPRNLVMAASAYDDRTPAGGSPAPFDSPSVILISNKPTCQWRFHWAIATVVPLDAKYRFLAGPHFILNILDAATFIKQFSTG